MHRKTSHVPLAKAGSKLATNAPFTVIDGAVVDGTKLLNQRQAPNDCQVNGTYWEVLGVFTTDTGTLQVKLANNANGPVAADAVRLFGIYPSISPPDAPSPAGAAASK